MSRAISVDGGPDDQPILPDTYEQPYYGAVNRYRFREIRESLGISTPEHLRVWLNDEDITIHVHEVVDGPQGRAVLMQMREGRMIEICGHIRLRPLSAGPPR